MTREELTAKLGELKTQKTALENETRAKIEESHKVSSALKELAQKGFALRREITKTEMELAALLKEEPAPAPAA